jgi:hypothetical protein
MKLSVVLINFLVFSCASFNTYSINHDEITLIKELSNILNGKEFDLAKREGYYHLIFGPKMNGNILSLYIQNVKTEEIILAEKITKINFINKIYSIEKRNGDLYFILTLTISGNESGIIYSDDTNINTDGLLILQKLDGHLFGSNIYYYNTRI